MATLSSVDPNFKPVIAATVVVAAATAAAISCQILILIFKGG